MRVAQGAVLRSVENRLLVQQKRYKDVYELALTSSSIHHDIWETTVMKRHTCTFWRHTCTIWRHTCTIDLGRLRAKKSQHLRSQRKNDQPPPIHMTAYNCIICGRASAYAITKRHVSKCQNYCLHKERIPAFVLHDFSLPDYCIIAISDEYHFCENKTYMKVYPYTMAIMY